MRSLLRRLATGYETQVLPRVIDKVCAVPAFRRHRRDAVAGVHGTVLEIGFGSGLNLPHYPPEVDTLFVVDPATIGMRLAAERIAAAPFSVQAIGLDGASLPVDDASVDHVVSTFTLCTIPDVESALAEVRRVLRPGGTFRVLEHGLSDDPRVARWQRRMTPLQKRIAGGCHLDRPVLDLLEGAGFAVRQSHQWTEGRPRSMSHFTSAIAAHA